MWVKKNQQTREDFFSFLSAPHSKDALLAQTVEGSCSWENKGGFAPGGEGICPRKGLSISEQWHKLNCSKCKGSPVLNTLGGCRCWQCSAPSSSQISRNWEESQLFQPRAAQNFISLSPSAPSSQFRAAASGPGHCPCPTEHCQLCPPSLTPTADCSSAKVPCTTHPLCLIWKEIIFGTKEWFLIMRLMLQCP